MSRVGSIQESLTNIKGTGKMAAADIKFNKTSMKIEAAYNLGKAAVQAYTAWTTASYNAEVKNIMSAYPSQYEQAKRIESLNKEYQLAAAFNPNLALTQYELLAGRGYTQFDDTTKSIAEKNSLEEISKSISKFTKPSELKQMVHEIKQKHKDTFGSLNTNFEANLNSYMDSADYMYKYPPEGKASYIQNANATLIDNQVNTLFSAETINTAEDFKKGFKSITEQQFSPEYAGNVELQTLTSMLSKVSDPRLLDELKNDPEFKKFFNQEQFDKWQGEIAYKAEVVRAKALGEPAKRAAQVRNLNKMGIGVAVPDDTDLDSGERRVNSYLMSNPAYGLSTNELDARRKGTTDPAIQNGITEIMNANNAGMEKDFLTVAQKIGTPQDLLAPLSIPSVKEGERLVPEELLNYKQSLIGRLQASDFVQNGAFKGDPDKWNFFGANELIEIKKSLENMDTSDKTTFVNSTIETAIEMNKAQSPHHQKDWATLLGKQLLDDDTYGFFYNKQEAEGGNYMAIWSLFDKLPDANKNDFSQGVTLFDGALSEILDPNDYQNYGKSYAKYLMGTEYLNGRNGTTSHKVLGAITFGKDLAETQLNFKTDVMSEILMTANNAGQLPFYLVPAKQSKINIGGKPSPSETSFTLKSSNDLSELTRKLHTTKIADANVATLDTSGEFIAITKNKDIITHNENGKIVIKNAKGEITAQDIDPKNILIDVNNKVKVVTKDGTVILEGGSRYIPLQYIYPEAKTLYDILDKQHGGISNVNGRFDTFQLSISNGDAEANQSIRHTLVNADTGKPYYLPIYINKR
jgi:hypothetical protein